MGRKKNNQERVGRDIAIIGMACRFPDAANYHQFAKNLMLSVNSIREIPPSRWDINKYYSSNFDEPNKSISKWCGLIENIDQFDNHFFNISPREANNMDPQQRILLEETWHCIEDAGISLNKLKQKITSVYIGVMSTDYHHESSASDVIIDSYAGLGNYDCILANRLSYFFGFRGQSESINAACASSLVALHEAKRSLILKESDYTLVGGVSLDFHPWKYISFSKSRMLSPDGQCKTFDKDANGYVPGEGVGVLILQRLEDALAEGNHIYGIIKGSAVNHGGRTLSITAPRVDAQKEVILSAYRSAGISPDTVTYVEAHGTGTSLGDPIEIEAITRAFREYTQDNQFCKIGSVKSNIGHLEAAAGIAGLIKVLLMIKLRKIPKSLNIKTLNPIINFEKSPFLVATDLSEWKSRESGIPLRAGVSSFGFGGTNSHVLLEEYAVDKKIQDNEPELNHLFILSAKSSNSLKILIEDWKLFVAGQTYSELSLKDMCLTLKSDRGNFPYRWGLHLHNKNELKGALNSATPSVPEKNKKYWCFRIGDFLFEGMEQFQGYVHRFDLFKLHVKNIITCLLKIKGTKASLKDFELRFWADQNKPLYSFILVYAGASTLLDLGFAPNVITGEKTGVLVGLVISGIMKLEDALALLSNEKKLHEIKFTRPKIPYYDSVIKKTVMPFHFSESYLRLLIDELSRQNKLLGHLLVDGILYTQEEKLKPATNYLLGKLLLRNKVITEEQLEDALDEKKNNENFLGNILVEKGYCTADDLSESLAQQDILRHYVHETFHYYVDKARMLSTSQFTFKKYLEEWDVILKRSGKSIMQLLYDDKLLSREGKRLRNEKLLVMIIIMNCLRKLDQKWNLTEQKLVEEKRFYELLDLVTDGVMPKEDLIELFLSDDPDFSRIARILNKQQVHMNLSHSYRYIKKSNPHIREIEDISRWLTETMETKNILPEDNLAYLPLDDIAFYEFGKFNTPLPTDSTIHLKMTENITELFTDSLLRLWLHGVDIHWEKLVRERSYTKVPLPLYPFDRKSFWLPHNANNKVAAVNNFLKTRITDKRNETSSKLQQIDQTGFHFKRIFSIQDNIIQDHVITGKPIIPGASMIEMGMEALQKELHMPIKEIKKIVIQNPCIVDKEVSLEVEIAPGEKRFVIKNSNISLCRGEYDTSGSKHHPSLDLSYHTKEQPQDISKLYPSLSRLGYQYGKGLQVIRHIWKNESLYVIELQLKKLPKEEGQTTQVNPRILDGIFQSALAVECLEGRLREDNILYVPYYIDLLSIQGEIKDYCFVCLEKKDIRKKGQDITARLSSFNSSGNCILWINEMLFKRVSHQFLSEHIQMITKANREYPEMHHASYYKPVWLKKSLSNRNRNVSRRAAILFQSHSDLSKQLSQEIATEYKRAFYINEGTSFLYLGDGSFEINAKKEQGYVEVIQSILNQIDGKSLEEFDIYHLWAYDHQAFSISDPRELREMQEKGVQSLFYLAKVLTKANISNFVKIIISTNKIHVIESHDKGEGYGFGGLLGLAKTIMLENPKIRIKIIDFGADDLKLSEKARILLDESLSPDTAEIVAYRKMGRYIRGIEPYSFIENKQNILKDNGVYLLIGGGGGIGIKVTEMIARQVKARVVLIDRSELNTEKQQRIQQLQKYGSKILYLQGDITNFQQMKELMQTIKAQYGKVNGVIQLVGVLRDKLLMHKDWESFQLVMAPKVYGTWIINQLTQTEPLDFFVVFSSIVSILGNIGQGDYAAANSFLDALIHYRIKNHYPGKSSSINWTLWADGGMGLSDQTRINFETRGLPPISSSRGLQALEEIIHYDQSDQLIVLSQKFKEFEQSQDTKLIEKIQKSTPIKDKHEARKETTVNRIEDYLTTILASKIDSTPMEINKEESFFALGVESIILQEIMTELDKKYEHLPPTLLFEYPNIRQLADYLKDKPLKENLMDSAQSENTLHDENISPENEMTVIEQKISPKDTISIPEDKDAPTRIAQPDINQSSITFFPDKEAPPTISQPQKSQDSSLRQSGYGIAVIGMNGRFPQAPNLDAYWQNLIEGRDCIEEIPQDRWEYKQFFDPDPDKPNKSYGKWGGFIQDIDKFDPLFFKISPKEAEQMDPQQRLLLECTWKTMEHAGYGARNQYKDKIVGLFVGTMWNEYSLLANQGGYLKNKYVGPGSIYWAIANRISYCMDFKGPSIALDTACSSSLIAVHLACHSILRGDCEIAVAGGINLSIHPSKYIYLSQARFLSKDGRCRSFGEGGTGYVPGEGVGAVLLKPLDKAIQDGDHIYGIIRGSATNHGGKATGFTVPNPDAHAHLIVKAFERANISAEQIGYIECHGTGTILGDPIEITGLNRAFRQYTNKNQFCPIGSVKSNIGHLEAAAGVAALIKVLLCMEHNKIPKSLHSDKKNPNIAFNETPFYVVNETTGWVPTTAKQLLAGISSFGAGGSNAHLVVESFEKNTSDASIIHSALDSQGPQIIVLSAKNEKRLKEYVQKFIAFLEKTHITLPEIAYTLQVGRQEMVERLALVVTTVEELHEKLIQYSQGKLNNTNLFYGNIKRTKLKAEPGEEGRELIKTIIHKRNFAKIGQLWISGAAIDWMLLYPEHSPGRVALPTYPFARERYWISNGENIPSAHINEPTAHITKLHPLLDQNISTLEEEKFSTLLTGNEFFLEDHRVNNKKLLPGVAFIEMVYAAAKLAGQRKVGKIRDIMWIRPIHVGDTPRQVFISLLPHEGEIEYKVSTKRDNQRITHARGTVIYDNGSSSQTEVTDIDDIKKRCKALRDGRECYRLFQKKDFTYGPRLQTIQKLWSNEREALSLLTISASLKADFKTFSLHPSLMDGALQTTLSLLPSSNGKSNTTYLPFSIGEVELISPLKQKCYAHVSFLEEKNNSIEKRFTIRLIDEEGCSLVEMHNVVLRALQPQVQSINPALQSGNKEMIYYKNLWEKSPLDSKPVSQNSLGHILLFDINEDLRDALRIHLNKENNSQIILVRHAQDYQELENLVFTVNPGQKDDYRQLMESLQRQNLLPQKIIYACPQEKFIADSKTVHSRLEKSIYTALYFSQALLEQKPKNKIQMLYAYSGDKDTPNLFFAALSGFARTIFKENSKFIYKIVEMGKTSTPDILLREMHTETENAVEVRYDAEQRWERHLREFRLEDEKADGTSRLLKEKGVYIITGGLGGLGLIFAEHLARHVRAQLVLSGRSELSMEKKSRIEKLESLGSEVVYIKADVSKYKDVVHLISETKARFQKINGVIHSAGLIRDEFIIKKTKEQMDAVLAPKVYGTIFLDEATKNDPLDFFVMFSSITAVMGNPGQCDYAYGNSFMDHYARMREGLVKKGERFGKTLSINWPLWKEGGMRVNEQTEKFLEKTMGMKALETEDGINAFMKGLTIAESQFLPVAGDRQTLMKTLKVRKDPLHQESFRNKGRAVQGKANRNIADGILFKIRKDIVKIVSDLLGVKEDDVHLDEDLSDYGFDSVSFTEFANRINLQYILEITPTIFFEHPSIESFTLYLYEEYQDNFSRYYQDSLQSESPLRKQESDEITHVEENIPQGKANEILPEIKKDVTKIVSNLLGVKENDVQLDEDLSDYGFDSVSFTEFANRINLQYTLEIIPTIFFEHPSIESFTHYLYEEYPINFNKYYQDLLKVKSAGMQRENGDADRMPKKPGEIDMDRFDPKNRFQQSNKNIIPENDKPRMSNEPVAIIGMNGVMPQSEDLKIFWKHLDEGKDLITEIPGDRWDWETYYGDPSTEANKTKVKWGGFMKEVDKFDALFFNISPREAELMDPQQRIFLETVWKAIEDAGYKPSDLSGTNTGIFVGAATSDYHELLKDYSITIEAHTSTGRFHSITANRISYLLNLHGPSEPIDTACSSSLIAIHRAVQAIRSGNCDMAVAGGVNALLTPTLHISFSKAGMLCEDGRCKTFDKQANGYVRGEGAGAVLLKSLSKAEADGDNIYAVIKATAENHGGHANSLTAPNPNAQAEVIISAYEEAQIDPGTVSYIEAHGTGTSLGDPIEINGLKKAFQELYKKWGKPLPKAPHCGIGTVKTNIGHLETAAGIAGILKVLLAMKYQKLPANIHLKELNPYIQLQESPFYIVREGRQWEWLRDEENHPIPRRAGVSSFGFGGANAHIVLEEYTKSIPQPDSQNQGPHIIVLSARNEERLKAYAGKLRYFLAKEKTETGDTQTDINLADIAYTLQIGREAMEERLAVIVSSKEQLIEKLASFRRGENDVQDLYQGNVSLQKKRSEIVIEGRAGEEFIRIIIADKELSKLARLWVSGIEIDWKLLYSNYTPQRISLPTYPFARERYWIPKISQMHNGVAKKQPFIDKIIPTLSLSQGLVFQKILQHTDLIVKDHRIQGQSILPGVGYLEMAYEAVSEIKNNQSLNLAQVVWLRPLPVRNEKKKIHIIIKEENEQLRYEIQTQGTRHAITHAKGVFHLDETTSEKTDQYVSLEEIKAGCTHQIDKENLYAQFKKLGIDYGPYFQGVSKIWTNGEEALGHLILPSKFENELNHHILHPTLMDGALQTIAGLTSSAEQILLPFAIENVEILHPLTSRGYSYIKDLGNHQYHIAIVDESGLVCIKLHDVTLRELEDPLRHFFYFPKWIQSPLPSLPVTQKDTIERITAKELDQRIILILYPPQSLGLEKALKDSHPNDEVIQIKLGTETRQHSESFWEINTQDSSALDSCIRQLSNLHCVYFLGGIQSQKLAVDNLDALEHTQEKGVLSLFRLIKSLSQHNFIQQSLQLKVITNNTHQIASEQIFNPYAASLFGFIKVMVAEYSSIEVSCIDISLEENAPEEKIQTLVRSILREPGNKKGKEVVIRDEIRYERALVPITLPSLDKTPFRHQGVYVILGGAGGIGLELSRYLAETVEAQLVLLGRSELDASRKEKISQIESKGGKVLYLKADATDSSGMKASIKKAKSQFGKINGVIHSAIVLKDMLIEHMDEENFRSALAPKVQGSMALYKAVEKEPLDFMMFFSSAVSFFGNRGQSNYTAGCAFKDAFALSLNRKTSYPVKTINWGFWGSVGVASSEEYKRRLTALGAESIEPEEGMEAIKRVLGRPVDQIMAMKAEELLLEQMGVDLTHHMIIDENNRKLKLEERKQFQEKKESDQPSKINSERKGPQLAGNTKDEVRQYIEEKIVENIKVSIGMNAKAIDFGKPFPEYGVDSIIGVELINKLNKVFDIVLKTTVIFTYGNVYDLSRYVFDNYWEKIVETIKIRTTHKKSIPKDHKISTNKLFYQGRNINTIGADTETKSENIVEESKREEKKNNWGNLDYQPKILKFKDDHIKFDTILLTGPTGILGGYLLKELLEKTSAQIFCLIRAKDIAHAQERLKKILTAYKAEDKVLRALIYRVLPIIGDITKENLGLSEKDYQRLVNSIDCTIHIAASTNLIMPYDYLAPINVQGVKNIIDLVLQTKQKYMIHVSSYHVMADVIYRSNFAFTEQDFNVGQDFSKMGYQQTKFEGERLVRKTSQEGLIWNIVRPGNIFGEEKSGLYPLEMSGSASIFHRLFELIIKSGVAAFGHNYFDVTPVDYIAKGILHLGLKRNSFFETYHLLNTDIKKWHEIIHLVNEYGYQIKLIPVDDYLKMVHQGNLPLDEEVAPEWLNLMKYGFAYRDFFINDGHADANYTHSILKKEDIICPHIDGKLLGTYLTYYITKGIIPPPPRQSGQQKNPLREIQTKNQHDCCKNSTNNITNSQAKEKTMKSKEYEFIIVGSGAGGATVAKELAKKGKKVLIVERGKRFKKIGGLLNSFYSFDHHKVTLWPKASKEGVFLYRGIMAGGSTALSCGNGTRCAEKELAAFGTNLNGEFEEAEKEMGIEPFNLRWLSKGSKKILEASKELGYHMEPMPKFMRYSKCRRCGTCYMGCRYNARWTALDYVDEALQLGADIIYETEVEQILHENGKAVGVRGKGPKGQVEIFAEVIVLSAGGLGTPVILQKSGIEDAGTNLFGDLLVNTYGVTKNLSQLGEPSMALVDHEFHKTKGFILSTWPQPSRIYRFAEAGVRGMLLPPDRTLGIMTKSTDDPIGRVYPDGSYSKSVTENDRARLKEGSEIAKKILIKAGAESKSIVIGSPFGAHPGGTAAIGKIVNKDMETQIDNLFVCDASVFPTSLGAPPILTIAALGKRLAKSLVSKSSVAKRRAKDALHSLRKAQSKAA